MNYAESHLNAVLRVFIKYASYAIKKNQFRQFIGYTLHERYWHNLDLLSIRHMVGEACYMHCTVYKLQISLVQFLLKVLYFLEPTK